MVLMSSYSPFWDSTFCLGNQIECGRTKFITKITYLQKNLEIDQLRIISYLAPDLAPDRVLAYHNINIIRHL